MGNKYIPGVCNIGKQELRKRKASGWAGLVLTLLAVWLLWYFNTGKWWRLLVFIPAVMGAAGFIQAYSTFCVYFGFKHLFNFGNLGSEDTVEKIEFRRKDRRRAWQLVGYIFLTAVLVTLIVFVVL